MADIRGVFGPQAPTPADEVEPTEQAASEADFAALIDRRYAPLSDGRYLVELLARDIKSFKTEWKSGVAFV